MCTIDSIKTPGSSSAEMSASQVQGHVAVHVSIQTRAEGDAAPAVTSSSGYGPQNFSSMLCL